MAGRRGWGGPAQQFVRALALPGGADPEEGEVRDERLLARSSRVGRERGADPAREMTELGRALGRADPHDPRTFGGGERSHPLEG